MDRNEMISFEEMEKTEGDFATDYENHLLQNRKSHS